MVTTDNRDNSSSTVSSQFPWPLGPVMGIVAFLVLLGILLNVYGIFLLLKRCIQQANAIILDNQYLYSVILFSIHGGLLIIVLVILAATVPANYLANTYKYAAGYYIIVVAMILSLLPLLILVALKFYETLVKRPHYDRYLVVPATLILLAFLFNFISIFCRFLLNPRSGDHYALANLQLDGISLYISEYSLLGADLPLVSISCLLLLSLVCLNAFLALSILLAVMFGWHNSLFLSKQYDLLVLPVYMGVCNLCFLITCLAFIGNLFPLHGFTDYGSGTVLLIIETILTAVYVLSLAWVRDHRWTLLHYNLEGEMMEPKETSL